MKNKRSLLNLWRSLFNLHCCYGRRVIGNDVIHTTNMRIYFLLVLIIQQYAVCQSLNSWITFKNDSIALIFDYPSDCELEINSRRDSIKFYSIDLGYMCYDTVDLKSNYDSDIEWGDSSEFIIVEIPSYISIYVSNLDFFEIADYFGYTMIDNEWNYIGYEDENGPEYSTVDSVKFDDWKGLSSYDTHIRRYLKGGNGCWSTASEQIVSLYYKKISNQFIYVSFEGCDYIREYLCNSINFLNK